MLDEKYLIKSRKKLNYYLNCDKVALGITKKKPSFIPMVDKVWKFEILLRKTEFYSNQKGLFNKLIYFAFRYFLAKKMQKHCLEIPLNCIREGLTIWHLQNIIINGKSKIGRNCSISGGVKIGQKNDIIPEIGNNNTLMLDCKVLGAKTVSNVAIGAGALLINDVLEEDTVVVGVPAKKINTTFPGAVLERQKRISEVVYE